MAQRFWMGLMMKPWDYETEDLTTKLFRHLSLHSSNIFHPNLLCNRRTVHTHEVVAFYF